MLVVDDISWDWANSFTYQVSSVALEAWGKKMGSEDGSEKREINLNLLSAHVPDTVAGDGTKIIALVCLTSKSCSFCYSPVSFCYTSLNQMLFCVTFSVNAYLVWTLSVTGQTVLVMIRMEGLQNWRAGDFSKGKRGVL